MTAAIGGALVLLVTWRTLVDMALAWRAESYQYAWLVLPLVACLLWSGRQRHMNAGPPEPTLAGLVVVIVAIVGWSVAWLMNVALAREVALLLALHGIVLSAVGWRIYRQLFPVLALTFLMIPSGDLLCRCCGSSRCAPSSCLPSPRTCRIRWTGSSSS